MTKEKVAKSVIKRTFLLRKIFYRMVPGDLELGQDAVVIVWMKHARAVAGFLSI